MISDIFYDLEYCANNKKIEENELFIFLKSLAGLSVFYMFLVREYEDVKEKNEWDTIELFKNHQKAYSIKKTKVTALVCHGQINGVIAENNVVQKFMLDNPYM